eukprot:g32474.t1
MRAPSGARKLNKFVRILRWIKAILDHETGIWDVGPAERGEAPFSQAIAVTDSSTSGPKRKLGDSLDPSMPPKKKGKTGKKEAGAKSEAKASDVKGESTGEAAVNARIVQHPEFDLEAYIAKYKGQGRAARLSFIAEHCPEKREMAFKLLIDQLKAGSDTTNYSQTCNRVESLGLTLGSEYAEDTKWVGNTNRLFIEKNKQLEAALALARRDEEVAPIRKATEDLADLNFERGEYSIALQRYNEAANLGFKADDEARLRNCLKTIKCGLAMHNYMLVDKTYRMARRVRRLADYPEVEAQLEAAHGLWSLHVSGSGDYAATARAFFLVSKDIKGHFNDVLAVDDVVTYGCLAAFASLTRREILKVLEEYRFRQILEFKPEFNQILQYYLQSKYSKMFETLEAMRKDLLLDPFLHKHVPKLFLLIRERAIMQYFRAFTTLKLEPMAKVMGLKVPELQTHLANLIGDGRISARIDSANKVVYARSADLRDADYVKALEIGALELRNVKTMLMRISLSRNGLVVADTERRGTHDGETEGGALAAGSDAPISLGPYQDELMMET